MLRRRRNPEPAKPHDGVKVVPDRVEAYYSSPILTKETAESEFGKSAKVNSTGNGVVVPCSSYDQVRAVFDVYAGLAQKHPEKPWMTNFSVVIKVEPPFMLPYWREGVFTTDRKNHPSTETINEAQRSLEAVLNSPAGSDRWLNVFNLPPDPYAAKNEVQFTVRGYLQRPVVVGDALKISPLNYER